MATNRTRVMKPRDMPPSWAPIREDSSKSGDKAPRAPSTLSPEARRWWKRLCSEYDLTSQPSRLLLQVAMESFDSMREAQKAIERHGVDIVGTDGQIKVNPCCATARDARGQLLTALKALNLAHEVQPLHDGPGRPSGTAMVGNERKFFDD